MDLNIIQLRETARVVHLLFHRNKNQHRQAKWWKWISMLKRCLTKLLLELEAPDSEKYHARVQFMIARLLPRCYSSFTQVVQDNQFCTLGLVLLAQLARIRQMLGAQSVKEEDSSEPAPQDPSLGAAARPLPQLEEVGEAVERDFRIKLSPVPPLTQGISIALSRTTDGEQANTRDASSSTLATDVAEKQLEKVSPSKTQSSKRKKRKGGNVIDDLFRGL